MQKYIKTLKERATTAGKCKIKAQKERRAVKQSTKDQKGGEAAEVLTLRDGTTIKVIPFTDHVKYLGKQFNFINHTDKDLDARIRNGLIQFDEF